MSESEGEEGKKVTQNTYLGAIGMQQADMMAAMLTLIEEVASLRKELGDEEGELVDEAFERLNDRRDDMNDVLIGYLEALSVDADKSTFSVEVETSTEV
jgi:hypothetical protein